ncbi:Serine/threonine-protein kinase SKY1 [Ceratocystis fimbriata CBS 114723]|uniref:non-specific serine/threonine protein kinase n=1 Tax=Ceratocystis fimbriata CBS 114723 TaxID=1035309 RepID=A0A2C5X327_9PEZI|nr:Serine/threonine-protein kinase SKY1 [Ceratocystis fimbriata CBS 114723]
MSNSTVTSPPPTPPMGKRGKQRFKSINLPCEWVEDYYPGSYHPVILGDVFKNGQYKVIRKLGDGSFSTVWLAHDLINNRYIALKIMVSKVSQPTNELELLHHIAKSAPAESAQYITELLDEFEHHGPNGMHKCLAFEPMGPSVSSMVEELPQFNPRMFGMKVRYPPQMVRGILKQALQALEFLHSNGIAHGDFQPGNILFVANDINSLSEEVLRQAEDVETYSISKPVERLDGKEDKWAPKYLCVGQPLVPFTNHGEGFKVKLSDLGGSYFFNKPPAKVITPLGLRPPEMILTGTVDKRADIWSFGCLLFEFITGESLFLLLDHNFEDDEYLLALTGRLGTLPDELFRHWKSSSLYYTPDKKLFNTLYGGVKEGGDPYIMDEISVSMEQAFDRTNPDLGEEEASQVKSLIRRILHYDPLQRPSPAEILSDPWFSQ